MRQNYPAVVEKCIDTTYNNDRKNLLTPGTGRAVIIAACTVARICSCNEDPGADDGATDDPGLVDLDDAAVVSGVDPVIDDVTEVTIELGTAM